MHEAAYIYFFKVYKCNEIQSLPQSSNVLIPISLQPDSFNRCYSRLFDLTELIV